jgi:hypothetical protein
MWQDDMDDKAEMLKALAAYRGPVRRCPKGRAGGAGDLHTWALRRAEDKSGVPDEPVSRYGRKTYQVITQPVSLSLVEHCSYRVA